MAAAASPLSRAAVALCSLFYLRLQRGRRLREASRRSRASRFHRAGARGRRRFAALCCGIPAPHPAAGRQRRLWSRSRCSSFWDTVRAKSLSGGEWAEQFRLGPDTFDYLCGRLREAIGRRDTAMRRAVPAEVRLALTLWRLGGCAEYRAVERRFGVSRSAVCRILRDVCGALVSSLGPAWASPPTRSGGFALPQLTGVLVGLRVPIRAPPGAGGRFRCGAGGGHAVELRAAVDRRGCLWGVEVAGPRDGLRASALYRRAQRGGLCPVPPVRLAGVAVPPFLLGRAGDPLLPWLLRPFRDPGGAAGGEGRESGEGRRRFNEAAAAARRGAEEALGRLRGRFRCLQHRNDTALRFLPTLLRACCLLHNVCQARGEPCPPRWLRDGLRDGPGEGEGLRGPEEEEEEEEGEGEGGEGEEEARRIREALARVMRG